VQKDCCTKSVPPEPDVTSIRAAKAVSDEATTRSHLKKKKKKKRSAKRDFFQVFISFSEKNEKSGARDMKEKVKIVI
jgi:hypothetical protein